MNTETDLENKCLWYYNQECELTKQCNHYGTLIINGLKTKCHEYIQLKQKGNENVHPKYDRKS